MAGVHRFPWRSVGSPRVVAFAGVFVAVLGCLVVWHPLYASFAATTFVGGSQLQAGTVSVASPANAVILVTGAIPGSSGSSCVNISYTGSLSANIRLYLPAAGVGGTGLASYLTLQIKQGSGSSADCSDFAASATLYNPTGLTDTTCKVTTFSAASSAYATGVDNWAATTSATRTYQFNWQLQDDNASQSLTASMAFTWEAQS